MTNFPNNTNRIYQKLLKDAYSGKKKGNEYTDIKKYTSHDINNLNLDLTKSTKHKKTEMHDVQLQIELLDKIIKVLSDLLSDRAFQGNQYSFYGFKTNKEPGITKKDVRSLIKDLNQLMSSITGVNIETNLTIMNDNKALVLRAITTTFDLKQLPPATDRSTPKP